MRGYLFLVVVFQDSFVILTMLRQPAGVCATSVMCS